MNAQAFSFWNRTNSDSEADLDFLKGEGQAKIWGKRRGIFFKFGADLACNVPHLDHFGGAPWSEGGAMAPLALPLDPPLRFVGVIE